MGFIKFMGSPAGRITRILAGAALVAAGLVGVGGSGGYGIAAVGVLPLAAGLFDFCLFAPLFGLPFGGKSLRSRIA